MAPRCSEEVLQGFPPSLTTVASLPYPDVREVQDCCLYFFWLCIRRLGDDNNSSCGTTGICIISEQSGVFILLGIIRTEALSDRREGGYTGGSTSDCKTRMPAMYAHLVDLHARISYRHMETWMNHVFAWIESLVGSSCR